MEAIYWSIFIAEVIPFGCVGIMTCAYSVDVKLLHEHDILYHAFATHYKAP